VVIISDASPAEADSVLGVLLGGAQDYVFKRELSDAPALVGERLRSIATQFKSRAQLSVKMPQNHASAHKIDRFRPDLLAVAASTGGTEALVALFSLMPVDCPPLLVVQHITPHFAKAFAERLARVSGLKLGENEQDAPLEPGHLYMAHGDYHIAVRKTSGILKLNLSYSPPENSVRPAADVLMRSVARNKISALGVILTGMGKDGAMGILEMKQSGAFTLAQDEASCVVFGMPKEAIQLGAARFIGNIRAIRSEIDQCLAAPQAKPGVSTNRSTKSA
jgi:two-component system chemotaxis response regulator CheB